MKKIYTLLFISAFSFYFSSGQVTQLWGLTSAGADPDSGGTVFNIGLSGSGFNTDYKLDSATGINPTGSLIQANNGLLYGTAENGGLNDYGVIFSYDPANKIYADVYDFDLFTNGGYPQGSLILVNDSILYGMTSGGGIGGDGTIFSYKPTSNTFTHLYDLTDSDSYPLGGLIQATDGKLYGLTQGGAINAGALFRYDITNGAYTNMHLFNSASGTYPNGSLLQAGNGLLYGMAEYGGANGYGVIFSYNTADSVYTDVYNFLYNDTSGAYPLGSLTEGSDLLLYGMSSAGGANLNGTIFNFNPNNNRCADLFDFDGQNGAAPVGDLLQADNGKLYGMTPFGGADSIGNIFSFEPPGTFEDLVDFTGANGQFPDGNLIQLFFTGIHEITNNEDFQIYPNPASHEVIIDLKGTASQQGIEKINIYNLLGENVYSEVHPFTGSLSQTNIDVSNFSEGIYYVQLYEAKGVWTGKFIKE